MSARKATRPDLATADVRHVWTPKPGDRVRRSHQTSHSAITQGTARVLWMKREGRVDVAVDPRPHLGETQEVWQVWSLDDTHLVREAGPSAHKTTATQTPETPTTTNQE